MANYKQKKILSEIRVAEEEIERLRGEIKKEYASVKDFQSSFEKTDLAIKSIESKKSKITKYEKIIHKQQKEFDRIESERSFGKQSR